MTAHGLTMMATVGTFFGILWFGVFIVGLTPGTAFVASLATLTLLGVGVMFTRATFRHDDDSDIRP